MKKSMLNITVDRAKGLVRQALSPTFLIILLGAALLWYISKLSGEYTNEMELSMRIDGQKYRPTVVVYGRGSAILAQQLSLKSRINLTLDELSPRPSRETLGALTIAPASLAKAINSKITDLTVMEVVEAPEFTPPSKEEEVESGSDSRGSKDGKDGSGDDDGETPREKRKRERLERRQAKQAARAAEEAEEAEAAKAAETARAAEAAKKKEAAKR
jgi:hypothetical protein